MENYYLIPANSKKSMLIFGAFNTFDLILLGIGLGISILLLLILPIENFGLALITLSPGLICTFLVIPIPNYHNILTIIKSVIAFYTTRQRYVWKGWCIGNGEE